MKFMKGAYAKYIEQDPFTVGRCARNTMTCCNGLDTEGRRSNESRCSLYCYSDKTHSLFFVLYHAQ